MTGYSVYENVLCECFLRQRLSLQMFLLSQKDGAKVVIIFFPHKFLGKKNAGNVHSRIFYRLLLMLSI